MDNDSDTTYIGGADPWQQTPWWHWRYWFDYRMRQWAWHNAYSAHDGQWSYRTYVEHAKAVLAEYDK